MLVVSAGTIPSATVQAKANHAVEMEVSYQSHTVPIYDIWVSD